MTTNGYDYKKGLDNYEKSVELHVEKVNRQLDDQLAVMRQKLHEKTENLKQMEIDTDVLEKENEKMNKKIRMKEKKIAELTKQNKESIEKARSFDAQIQEVQEKTPQKAKIIEELLKELNEKRRFVAEKQREITSFRVNRTEQSLKSKLEMSKKKLEETRLKKMAQDKRIGRLRSDISRSEKSFDTLEKEIHKEFKRQLENESKKEEVERRIRIFEIENSGVADEFKSLMISLNENGGSSKEHHEEERIAELEILIAKGKRYLEKLEEKIEQVKNDGGLEKNLPNLVQTAPEVKPPKPLMDRKSRTEPERIIWKKMDDIKREIIQYKREHEALIATKRRLQNETELLQKQMEEEQKNVDRAAFELRNAENIRMAELNEKDKKLKPSVLVDSKEEKSEKERIRKVANLKERVEKMEKDNELRKAELDKLLRRNETLRRKLQSNSREVDVVRLENEKNQKTSEIRILKKKWHESVMLMNSLHKKLQQRVLQREAAMATANSVVHLTTNIRGERRREIDELQKQIQETQKKFIN